MTSKAATVWMVVISMATILIVSCSFENDRYLKSLSPEVSMLYAVDTVDIEQYDLFQAAKIVFCGDGRMLLSSIVGDYNLLFLDMNTGNWFPAIRRGRGPGEIIQGSSLHMSGERVLYYDVNNAICISICIDESFENQCLVADTAGIFNKQSRPVYLSACGDGFVSGNLVDDDCWYSFYDKFGNIHSSIMALECDGLPESGDRKVSLLLSSLYAAHPDGTKVCVANVPTPSLSFSAVRSGKLEEYHRMSVSPVGLQNGRLTQKHTTAFSGICADNRHVYVLYSGNRTLDGKLPSDECCNLIVYDWDGNPVKRYALDQRVHSIHVVGNRVYGATTYPESRVYMFLLD